MNNIKSEFSIKDLENLSGIKAHTIRIWEKRYGLLEPNRTDTNIRLYPLKALQKLLNVSYLNNNGYKISKISSLTEKEIIKLVSETANQSKSEDHILNMFKVAMLNFNQEIFQNTLKQLEKTLDFEAIFFDVFIPLLDIIGLLWQTNTITPAHEHFIAELIKHKLLVETAKASEKVNYTNRENAFILFLPNNEIHELGLLYTNFELTKKGYHTIYLGQSVPVESLLDTVEHFDKITFISSFTVQPSENAVESYLKQFGDKILTQSNSELWITGRMINTNENLAIPEKVKTFSSVKNLTKTL